MRRQPQPAKLSLADVIEMAKAGCLDEVIINQIRKTGSTYDLSVKDIINLKKNGVGDGVIIEMQGGFATEPNSIRGVSSTEPNVRMPQLLQHSNDLKQIGPEWRRFWFNDSKTKCDPSRIHGGII